MRITPPRRAGLLARFISQAAKRRLGQVPEPVTIRAHHNWISFGAAMYEFANENARQVEAKLKFLAQIKAATMIGCPF